MTGTYVDLQNRIADELLTGATVTTAQIKLEILSAIQHYERERFWFNEAQTTLSTAASANSVAVPSDLLESTPSMSPMAAIPTASDAAIGVVLASGIA